MTLCTVDDQYDAQLSAGLACHTGDDFLEWDNTRPMLKHLNADSSWLISLPYPEHIQSSVGRQRYNIVLDPWLRGPQVDFHRWFSSQEHAERSSTQSLQDLDKSLRKAEVDRTGRASLPEACHIDAIICSHEFTDHCHEATLKELPPTVPIFAPKKAADRVRSWQYFESVSEVPENHMKDASSNVALQTWISLSRVCTPGDGPAYLHSALLLTFTSDKSSRLETIVYTPHGITVESLRSALDPDHRVLALLHGLHDISLAGSQLNLGRENAVKIAQALKVAYWLPTHDEVKVAHGLVALLLRRISHTLEMAPASHPITDDINVCEPDMSNFFSIGNGQVLVLN